MLVKNTLEVECLVQALTDLIEARSEHDKARDEYEGSSWGYYGDRYVRRMEDAADEFGNRLNALIDARIAEKLNTKE